MNGRKTELSAETEQKKGQGEEDKLEILHMAESGLLVIVVRGTTKEDRR